MSHSMIDNLIYVDPYCSNNHDIKKIGGIDGIKYKIIDNKIIFKVNKNSYIYFVFILYEILENNYINSIKINNIIYNINNLPLKIILEDNIIEIELNKKYEDVLKNYTFYIIKNNLPDHYYHKKELNRYEVVDW